MLDLTAGFGGYAQEQDENISYINTVGIGVTQLTDRKYYGVGGGESLGSSLSRLAQTQR